jgi:hypothetical protein
MARSGAGQAAQKKALAAELEGIFSTGGAFVWRCRIAMISISSASTKVDDIVRVRRYAVYNAFDHVAFFYQNQSFQVFSLGLRSVQVELPSSSLQVALPTSKPYAMQRNAIRPALPCTR